VKYVLAILLLGCLCCQVAADGVIRDSLGARVAGRGGTNVGFADSGMILHDNPAGMVNVASAQLVEFGFDVMITDVEYSDPDDFDTSDHDPIPLGNLAAIRKSEDEQWAIGIGAFTPGGFATDYDLNGPFPLLGKQKYKSFGSLIRILPGVAHCVNDQLSIGGTLGVAVSHTELEGPHFLQSGPLIGTPTLMDMQATGAALTWSFGMQYLLTQCTTVGLAYQSETRFNLDGHTTTSVPMLGQSAFDTTLDMTWPRTLTFGLRQELTPSVIGSVDVIWYNWSEAFDYAGLHLKNPTNPILAGMLGPAGLTEQFPLLWNDSVSVRVGMEKYLCPHRVVRAGYTYNRNPVPAATLTPYIPTIVEHVVGVGLGWYRHSWETDIAYQFFFTPTERVGTSDLIGGDFNQSELRPYAHIIYLGFTKRY
jgi:long-subunit fatty acid transport protein